MSATMTEPGATPLEAGAPLVLERKKFRPVVGLAMLGIAITVFQTYVIMKWITGPNFKPTPVGPSEVPTFMKVGLTGLMIIGGILWIFCMWHFLIKPWRRDGKISLDGYFAICFVLIYWMDPLGAALVPQFTYNAWLPNMGSWLSDTPGVTMPNGHMIAEPYLLTWPLYLWCIFGVVVIANKLMVRAQTRWPQMSNVKLVCWTIGLFILWDLFWELTFIRIGYWVYPTVPSWLSIFGEHYYRIHITEPIFWGTTWGLFACLRYFKNDKGQTLAERGIDQVQASPRGKGALRFFALYGTLCSIFLLFYVVGTNAVAIHGDAWPEDILKRSYFTNFVCGPETDYACPSQGTPIFRPNSAHIDEHMNLHEGTVELRTPVTFETPSSRAEQGAVATNSDPPGGP